MVAKVRVVLMQEAGMSLIASVRALPKKALAHDPRGFRIESAKLHVCEASDFPLINFFYPLFNQMSGYQNKVRFPGVISYD